MGVAYEPLQQVAGEGARLGDGVVSPSADGACPVGWKAPNGAHSGVVCRALYGATRISLLLAVRQGPLRGVVRPFPIRRDRGDSVSRTRVGSNRNWRVFQSIQAQYIRYNSLQQVSAGRCRDAGRVSWFANDA